MLRTLVIVTAVGSAAVGGVCLAFSAFVMRALGDLAPERAIEAMQAINRFAPTPVFMLAFGGTAVTAATAAVVALVRGAPGTPWLLAGCGLYLVGMVGVTAAANVPLNDTLAAVDPSAPGAAAHWAAFAGPWTAFNHLRTVAALAAAATLTAGLAAS